MKEDKESWRNFLRYLKERGLKGVKLIVSDKSLGLLESLGEFFAEAQWQRCMVHWYRNVLRVVPRGRRKDVAALLKAIHGQEDRQAAREKAAAVVEKLVGMKLGEAAKIVEEGADETLAYMGFPREHWTRIRTNNMLERLMREIRRRTRVVGAFPDGRSALMLVAAGCVTWRLRAGARDATWTWNDCENRPRRPSGKGRIIVATGLPLGGAGGGRATPTPEPLTIQCAQLDRQYLFCSSAHHS